MCDRGERLVCALTHVPGRRQFESYSRGYEFFLDVGFGPREGGERGEGEGGRAVGRLPVGTKLTGVGVCCKAYDCGFVYIKRVSTSNGNRTILYSDI